MAEMSDVERRLRIALAPVEPPGSLTDRLDRTLTELTEAAADELADWELRSMRDPRNWARPAAALVVGGIAGGALIVVRARQQQKRRDARGVKALEGAIRDVRRDLRRRLGR